MRVCVFFVVMVTALDLMPSLYGHAVESKENGPHVHRRANEETNSTSQEFNETTSTSTRRHIRITTIVEEPFLVLREGAQGNDRFEGYIPDVLRSIAERLSFDYTLNLVADGKYGSRGLNGTWTGMVGEVMYGEADMAAAALTISYLRETVIDFSKPFMTSSTTVIQKKPSVAKESNLFAIFEPFTIGVWLCLLLAFFVVAMVIYFLNRVSPYEWRAAAKRGKVSGRKANHLNVRNSLWFALSTLTLQGYHKSPRSVSVRFLAAFWFFFVFVILFAYLSNLSPFLTRVKATPSIESVAMLSRQSDVSYGAIRHGSTAMFFKYSEIDMYKRMWNFMAAKTPSVFVGSLTEGVERVRNSEGKYAFIGESPSLEHIAAKPPCDLTFVPGSINMRSFGFAFPQNSALRDEVTLALLMLQEDGHLDFLKRKWWTGSCDIHDNSVAAEVALRPRATAISLANISGVFILLLIGIAVSVPLALCEWFVYNAKEEKKKKQKRDVPKSESGAQTDVSGV